MTSVSDLGTFKLALADALARARGVAGVSAAAVDRIVASLARKAAPLSPAVPGTDAYMERELDGALENARAADADGAHADLLAAFHRLAPALPWYRRACPDRPDFEAGHANAEIIGAKGLEVRSDLTVGVTLMVPGLTYPDHHHPPEEVYLVLSAGAWRQDANPWHEPGFGGFVYNPPDILHAMKSLDAPLFAIWSLNPTAG